MSVLLCRFFVACTWKTEAYCRNNCCFDIGNIHSTLNPVTFEILKFLSYSYFCSMVLFVTAENWTADTTDNSQLCSTYCSRWYCQFFNIILCWKLCKFYVLLCFCNPTVLVKILCVLAVHLSVLFVFTSQILLPCYLMSGLRNLDETHVEYSLAPTHDLIRFWRSEVKVTAGHWSGKGIQSTLTLGRQSRFSSVFLMFLLFFLYN